jgi:uncharacterized protein (TIGR00255 family)
MTGFGTAELAAESFQINWEIRSVNNRFLELSFRMPEELRTLEPRLREIAGAKLGRGKVDCTLKLAFSAAHGNRKALDTEVLGTLWQLQAELRPDWPDAQPLSMADLLKWPGLLVESKRELHLLTEPAHDCFQVAVDALATARSREGGRIAEVLSARLAEIRDLLADIRPRLAGTANRHRDKLLERLQRLDVELQPERLEQEIALIAQRLDVTEETDRLLGHVTEVADVLARDEPIGRRLDFLIQELNREANTLGSKVQDEDLTRAAVDLKVLIEQMREQVQNLE